MVSRCCFPSIAWKEEINRLAFAQRDFLLVDDMVRRRLRMGVFRANFLRIGERETIRGRLRPLVRVLERERETI